MSIGDIPLNSVPLADPGADTQKHRDAIIAALSRVVNGGNFILGPEVTRFERSLATSLGVSDVVGVASGTDALVLAQLALGIGSGDEVIAPSHTAGPTIAAIHMSRATPVLVECNPETYCIDPAAVANAVTPRTKAIIAVHLYGHPANIDALRAVAPGIPIIEDCAQAHGARLNERATGALGTISCFSFYPTKNLGALGDGGAVATNDSQLATAVRRLRTYGWTRPQYAELENGRCSRLDEMQAAILSVKLEGLPLAILHRRSTAARYLDEMKNLPLILPQEAPGAVHSYHLFVVRSDRRDALEKHLQDAGIGTGRHYPFPAHVQPGFAAKARISGSLARTETLYGGLLSLPMFATISDEQTDRVIAAVRSFFA